MLLVLLYVFIATPVSFWHQHKTDREKNNTEQYSQTVKKAANPSHANCKICSHHYSVADNDAIIFSFPELISFTPRNSFYTPKKITNPGYSQSNKGPPATFL